MNLFMQAICETFGQFKLV